MASTINASTTGGGGVITTADASGVLNLQSNGVTMASISSSGFNLGGDTPSNATALSPYTGFKNRIINGAMMISQRNGTSSITATDGSFGVDRFKTAIVGTGVFTMQQSTTAPTGFSFSQLLTVTTADSSIAATDEYSYRHFVEGFNFADMMWGTANAQTVTLSFWVRSSVTGTYAVGLRNDAANRTYPATYTISAANTWEQKTITIAGDTSGTWVGATNGIGVGIIFSLGAGSNYQGTANAWNNGNVWSTSSATQWISNSGATFYITGVQLEKGSTATSFEYRPYGTELQLCQRYYQRGTKFASGYGDNTNVLTVGLQVPVQMRTQPSLLNAADSNGIVANGSLYNLTANSAIIANSWFSGSSMAINVTTNAQITRWTTAFGRINDLQLSAEL